MLGHLTQLEDRWQLRFTRELHHPPDKVWRALVEPDHLEAWFPTTVEGDRAEGATLTFSFREDEAPPMQGEMVTYQPHSVLEFKWGEDLLRFELEAVDAGTLLTLSDTFDELGRAARDAAGCKEPGHGVLGYRVQLSPGSQERLGQNVVNVIDRNPPRCVARHRARMQLIERSETGLRAGSQRGLLWHR